MSVIEHMPTTSLPGNIVMQQTLDQTTVSSKYIVKVQCIQQPFSRVVPEKTMNGIQLKLGGTNRAEMKAAAELLRENLPGLLYPKEADHLIVQWKGDNYDQ